MVNLCHVLFHIKYGSQMMRKQPRFPYSVNWVSLLRKPFACFFGRWLKHDLSPSPSKKTTVVPLVMNTFPIID